ncbi:MAG: hypothetical protein CM1200mP36_10290 [Gammaproteobacteria bacterium]|nr:MAG: hypothetical protein CM1200mP36_10290 [Gammaproteobacteria bacterium]
MGATKFTEVGYVGREVDSIVRDLADMAVKMMREDEISKVSPRAQDAAEDRLLEALLPGSSPEDDSERGNASGKCFARATWTNVSWRLR